MEPSAGEITDILSLNTVVRDLSDGEKMELHQRYKAGDLSELAAGILLGESIESIENEKQAFREAMEMDRSGVFKKLDQ